MLGVAPSELESERTEACYAPDGTAPVMTSERLAIEKARAFRNKYLCVHGGLTSPRGPIVIGLPKRLLDCLV